jgi:LysM repeat protein
MPYPWNRRELLIAGAALLLSGCVRERGGLTARPVRPAAPDRSPLPSDPSSLQPQGLWYRIESGDTLSSLSRRSGLSVSEIAEANRLSSPLIMPGQRLWLPGVGELDADPLDQTGSAASMVVAGGYTLVPRSGWTKARIAGNHTKMGAVSRLTLHHTGQHQGMVGKSDLEIVRMIDRYHREGRKWSAIGYHYLVGRDGRIYEGRPVSIQGAHVSQHNSGNIGISCIGDFQQHLPSDRQLGALIGFLDDQRNRYGVPKKRIYGHKDLGNTVCPGKALHGWLKTWRA